MLKRTIADLKTLRWQNFLFLLAAGCINAVGVTEKPHEISNALIAAFKCGTTKIPVTGGYSNQDKTLLYFVVNRFQISKMRDIIHAIDPKAFVTISEVADVFKSND